MRVITHAVFNAMRVLAALPISAAIADENQLTYDRINFSVAAHAETENDTLEAVLYARREGPDLSVLSSEVNKAVAGAVKRAKQEPAVTVQTLNYETYPNYQNGRPAGWQVKQSIRLESRAPESIAKLIGELQSSLALGSMSYTVSPERRKEVEDRLIDQALSSFRTRAERLTQDFGRTQYRLVNVDLVTAGRPGPRPVPMMEMAAAPAGEPPTLEAGKQRIEVQVSGTIELQPK